MRTARGLSLVELLVGLAIGLLISTAGASLLVTQFREHRSAMIEMRLMQDLRTAADIVARDLRRAGHWGDAAAALPAAGASAPITNPYAALAPSDAASNAVSFSYSRDTAENHVLDSNEQFGFRLRNGAIELQLGAGNWQALTDAGTLTVTAFDITPTVQTVSLLEHCRLPCPAGSACEPRLQRRSLSVAIRARAVADASVERSLRSEVRVRNDALVGACPV